MLLVALVIGTVFALSGLIVTERNAKYLLAGYDTLPAQEREQIDIRSYVRHFRRFCILLGGTLFLFVAVLTALGAEVIGGVVTIVYPVIACMYLVWFSARYYPAKARQSRVVGLSVMSVVLAGVIVMLYMGLTESKIIIETNSVTLTGMYGETIPIDEIESIQLVDRLPHVVMRTDGFALGSVRKGYFKTDDGIIIKLMINEFQDDYVLVTKLNQERIYYSARNTPNATMVRHYENKGK